MRQQGMQRKAADCYQVQCDHSKKGVCEFNLTNCPSKAVKKKKIKLNKGVC